MTRLVAVHRSLFLENFHIHQSHAPGMVLVNTKPKQTCSRLHLHTPGIQPRHALFTTKAGPIEYLPHGHPFTAVVHQMCKNGVATSYAALPLYALPHPSPPSNHLLSDVLVLFVTTIRPSVIPHLQPWPLSSHLGADGTCPSTLQREKENPATTNNRPQPSDSIQYEPIKPTLFPRERDIQTTNQQNTSRPPNLHPRLHPQPQQPSHQQTEPSITKKPPPAYQPTEPSKSNA